VSEPPTSAVAGAIELPAGPFDIAFFPLGAASYGGAERSLLELASAQASAGRRVVVCHEPALGATDFVADARALGLPLAQVTWAPERSAWGVARAAVSLFRRLDTRIVQFNISWRPHMWLVPLAARLFGHAQLVGTMRAMPEPPADLPARRYFGLLNGPPLRHLQELVLGRVWARLLHRTVSVNRDDYPPRLIAEYGFKPRYLSVIYNGVRIPPEPPTPAERVQVRVSLGIAADQFALGFVGRVSPEKGVRFAIEAMALCDPSVSLWIAGEGPELESLRVRVRELGLQGRIHFLGYQADPGPLYRACDAMVVPSLWNEAFGRVVVEAMGSGTPVIATAVGGMRELFEDGREGWHVPKGDAAAIATAIERWVGDRATWQRMAEASRRLAVERYSTARVASEYGALYRALEVAA
jgi:glycosyltransferase involved in cell wall biosynthesis